MINRFDKVVVSHCLFEHCLTAGDITTTGGPGICIFYGSPVVTQSTFRNNAGTSAGAIKLDYTSNAVICNNVVSHNTSYCGAILCAYGSDNRPTLSGNVISYNVATGAAGGIFVYSQSNARIENNIITHNQAPIGGGVGCYLNASPVLVNNTIAYNAAVTQGGGIRCESNSSPILVNNILYGNSAPSGKQVYIADSYSDPIFKCCDIEGGKEGFAGFGAGANYAGLYEKNIDDNPALLVPESTVWK
jgi:parallel beta-helix repeat protein